jgi:hypothetical protein
MKDADLYVKTEVARGRGREICEAILYMYTESLTKKEITS